VNFPFVCVCRLSRRPMQHLIISAVGAAGTYANCIERAGRARATTSSERKSIVKVNKKSLQRRQSTTLVSYIINAATSVSGALLLVSRIYSLFLRKHTAGPELYVRRRTVGSLSLKERRRRFILLLFKSHFKPGCRRRHRRCCLL